tara:strand:- start:677 stop:1534 length:858 start_codon:yes stop_codon:yes gene_type:complete
MLDSPLRYPGGKAKIANFLERVLRENEIFDCEYVEPFAGGAGAALRLLSMEHARRIWINDLDPAIFCFWKSVLEHTDELCKLILNARLTLPEWRKQHEIFKQSDANETLLLGFATFYLNRTNRSGILTGSVIGGLDQTGSWLIDARFNKIVLVDRIKKISEYKNRIKLTNIDANEMIKSMDSSKKRFVYLDPPYFKNGKRLYLNHYNKNDHINLSNSLKDFSGKWVVTYDNAQEIKDLYTDYPITDFTLNYSASKARKGQEILIPSPGLRVPYEYLPGYSEDDVA